jgi:deoxyribodipyrimidine photo-lyase
VRTLVWFRGKELRLHDHLPLHDAVAAGDEIVTLFVLDPYFFDPTRARALPHRMQFLLESLRALEREIAARGGRLFVVRGRSVDVVPSLAERGGSIGWCASAGPSPSGASAIAASKRRWR